MNLFLRIWSLDVSSSVRSHRKETKSTLIMKVGAETVLLLRRKIKFAHRIQQTNCIHIYWKYQRGNFGVLTVILVHSDHRHVSTTQVMYIEGRFGGLWSRMVSDDTCTLWSLTNWLTVHHMYPLCTSHHITTQHTTIFNFRCLNTDYSFTI